MEIARLNQEKIYALHIIDTSSYPSVREILDFAE
ncbi:MAG: hypothetical protein ACHQXK_04780 [Methanosarcina thermophila]|jgi:hypothetical protein|nr:hypothetical protein [Methanosarcina thermophila]HOA69073.1 hypothetical protein [Methanosarcina thermophila]HOQ66077.1 hypothetical protein [Methanosarcina thermophila]HPT80495.1 hypothetical protein [Methanosarcina thermophila]HPZ20148.1 hypothetical protein [Methanosarcina thermophila]HQD94619.1 hypothetical protein [Methanosarcina thermophila]